jgi:NADH pyrophosphatase NudC (nudix superfamily)
MQKREGDVLPRQVFASYEPIRCSDERSRFCTQCGAPLATRIIDGTERKACRECGFVHYENPIPGVTILVVKGSCFLLCKRSAGAFRGGKWCLPCGYVEFGEDFLTAAKREVREEAGLDIRISCILSVVSNFLSPSIHSIVSVLRAEPLEERPPSVVDDENESVAWFSKGDDLPEMAFEADKHIIRRYFQDMSLGVPVEATFAS